MGITQTSGNTGINNATGFLARAYNNGTNEIVIAYAGTTDEPGMEFLDWSQGNIPAVLGFSLAPQILDAARFYLDVLKSNPGANITFTGHSLGGGLASLMAVYFNRPAYTFDAAPFERSADSASVVNDLRKALSANYSLAALAPDFLSYVPGQTNVDREGQVHHTYVAGEVLRNIPAYFAAAGALSGGVVGAITLGGLALTVSEIAAPSPEKIDPLASGVSAVNLHSIVLLNAFQQSPEFLDASRAHPELLQRIFDSSLFSKKPQNESDYNFLNLMLQQQLSDNQALDALALDIDKFTGALDPVASGLSYADPKLKTALYDLTISLYYGAALAKTGTSNSPLDAVFESVAGGIQFSPDPARQSDYKTSLPKVLEELGQYFKDVYSYMKPNADRYTLPTEGALLVSAPDDDKIDLMVGNTQADDLAGGGGNDILLGRGGADRLDGGAGDDTLYGGADNDTLIGGAGNDLYVIYSIDGADTIVDEGANRLMFNNTLIAGLVIKDVATGKYKFADDSGRTIEFHSPGVLTLDGSTTLTFQNQTSSEAMDNSFGLNVYDETLAPETTRNIVGDLAVSNTLKDDLGNYVATGGNAPGRVDTLLDSAGNDLIQGLGGNDVLNATRGGDDKIEGGDGNDWVYGGAGNDLVIGGAGRDVVLGGAGADELYADGEITLAAAIAAQNAPASGLQGEALSGADGDDVVVGGAGNDVLFGGTGQDILLGGAGNDDIEGDAHSTNIAPTWSVTRTITTDAGGTTIYYTTYNQFVMSAPSIGGDDEIYAGAGDDWANGGRGNDYVDGGAGNDIVGGDFGSDALFGDTGNDLLIGDNSLTLASEAGEDYLDGGAGDDVLLGGARDDILLGSTGFDELQGDAGDDYLDGESDDDTLNGGGGADHLFGSDGNDFLQGDTGDGVDDGNDVLDGGAGNDTLLGQGGSDELHGGEGNDRIAGDNGGSDTTGEADSIFGGAGDDVIDAQGGDDMVDAGADNDIVLGGLGNDRLAGDSGNDQLQGGNGDDSLEGGDGSDVLFGEAGDDLLTGGAGNDYLLGGMGNDTLDGGEGDDVYYISSFEGKDHIVDSGGIDWLVLQDLFLGSLVLGVGSLKLTVKTTGQEIHLDDFDPQNPYAAGGIEFFQFADGSVLSKAQLIDTLGFAPTGTPEADVLSGTALAETIESLAGDDVVTALAGNDTIRAGDGADMVYAGDGNDQAFGGASNDVLQGEGGNDTLYGDAGDDLLAGGAGTDLLQGGEGNDTYRFQLGDGQDTAVDALGANTIALGAGLTLDAIGFTRQGADLLVSVKNSADRLTVSDWFAADSHFASITLGDGNVLDHAGVEAAMPRNQAPIANPDAATVTEDGILVVSGNALVNDSDPEGRPLRVANPDSYAGAAGTLALGSNGAFTYTLSNTAPGVQSLAAGQSLTEHFAYTVTDDDPDGAATAESAIVITVQGRNDLPVLGGDSASAQEDAGPISGNVLANDSDIDAGTQLAVSNPGTRAGTFGTLALSGDGGWSYKLDNISSTVQALAAGQTALEQFAFNVSDGIAQMGGSLSIGIAGENDAPILVLPLADQSASANSSWTWQVPTGSFSDVDAGDALNYQATLADGSALPSWLAFDAATQSFSGRVPKSATTSLDIRVTATDGLGAAADDIFMLSFAAGTGGGGGGGGGNGGGGSQGNEGVGNGVDGPPPGHDTSFNDGPGTGPGNPGAKGGIGGQGYHPPARSQIVMTGVEIAGGKLPFAALSWSATESTNPPWQGTQESGDIDAGIGPSFDTYPIGLMGASGLQMLQEFVDAW